MDQIDYEAVKKGTIPWAIEEFYEVMNWSQKLVKTPVDDWDLKKRSTLIQDDEKGEVQEITFNPRHPMNQIAAYIRQKYDDKWPYHLSRFMAISNFLYLYTQDLVRDGLARIGENTFEFCNTVFEALCILPYSKVEIIDGDELNDFDYDEVVKKARELIEKSGQQHPS